MSPSEIVPQLIRQIYQVRPELKLPEAAIHSVLFRVRAAFPGNCWERKERSLPGCAASSTVVYGCFVHRSAPVTAGNCRKPHILMIQPGAS